MSSSTPWADDGLVVHTHRDGGYELINAHDEDQTLTLSLSQIFGRGNADRPDSLLSCPLLAFRAATPFSLPRFATSIGWCLVSQIFGIGDADRPDVLLSCLLLPSSMRHQAQIRPAATRPSPFTPDGEAGGSQKGGEKRKRRPVIIARRPDMKPARS